MAQYYGNVHFLAVCRIANTGGVVMAHLSYNTETDLNGKFGYSTPFFSSSDFKGCFFQG